MYPNFETIKILTKQKTQQNFSQETSPHPIRHSGKTSKPRGKTKKINPENKQSKTSGSAQATIVSQYTSTASKSSTTATAQCANWEIQ
jgi:hypothetical protein